MKAKLTFPKELLDDLIKNELRDAYGMNVSEIISIDATATVPPSKHGYEIKVELRTRPRQDNMADTRSDS